MPRNIVIGYGQDGLIDRAKRLAAANREQAEKERKIRRALANARSGNKPVPLSISQIPGSDENSRPRLWINYDESGTPGWLLVPSDNELNAKVRRLPPFRFVQGMPDTEPFIFAPSGGPGGQPYLEGAPGETASQSDAYEVSRKRPASGAITEECLFYLSSSNDGSGDDSAFVSAMNVQFSNLFISWLTIRNTTISRVVREVYAQGVLSATNSSLYYSSTYDDFDAPFFQDAIVNESLTAYGWHHVACVAQTSESSATSSLYFDGQRVLISDPMPANEFWYNYEERDRISIASRAFNIQNGITSHRVAGIRYTERALYTSDTYAPPTSITRLA